MYRIESAKFIILAFLNLTSRVTESETIMNLPWMVVNGKPRPGRNGMKSPCKYSMLHAEAGYDRR